MPTLRSGDAQNGAGTTPLHAAAAAGHAAVVEALLQVLLESGGYTSLARVFNRNMLIHPARGAGHDCGGACRQGRPAVGGVVAGRDGQVRD